MLQAPERAIWRAKSRGSMTLLAAWFGNPTPCSAVSLNWPSTCVAPGPQESACWKKGNVGSRCSAGRRWRVNSPRISPVGQPVRVKSQVRTGLPAGGSRIRTLSPTLGSGSLSGINLPRYRRPCRGRRTVGGDHDSGNRVRTRLPAGWRWNRTSGSGASGEADAFLPVKDRPR